MAQRSLHTRERPIPAAKYHLHAVWSYLGNTLDEDEAEEIAADFNDRWFDIKLFGAPQPARTGWGDHVIDLVARELRSLSPG
jgi:hypothetical protein